MAAYINYFCISQSVALRCGLSLQLEGFTMSP